LLRFDSLQSREDTPDSVEAQVGSRRIKEVMTNFWKALGIGLLIVLGAMGVFFIIGV
jgi:hypothetical protein